MEHKQNKTKKQIHLYKFEMAENQTSAFLLGPGQFCHSAQASRALGGKCTQEALPVVF